MSQFSKKDANSSKILGRILSFGLALGAGAAVFGATAPAKSYSGGITTASFGSNGCNDCHAGGLTPTLSFVGVYNHFSCATYPCMSTSDGSDAMYISFSGAQTKAGGNVSASGGVLSGYTASGANYDTYATSGEVTHNGRLEWTYFDFYWDPPATPGYYYLSAWGNSVNGDATTTGDRAANLGQWIAVCKDDDNDQYIGSSGSNPGVCPAATDCNDATSAVSPAGTETCGNAGVDNDCDGNAAEISNGIVTGTGCSTGNSGVCAAGTYGCSGSSLVCNQTTGIGTETCSNTGVDNDCDGIANEIGNGIYVGTACVTGQNGVCSPGTYNCAGASLVCTPNVTPSAETCSNTGVDNDCDGNATEIADNVVTGSACATGAAGICSPGTSACSGTSLVCNATAVAGTETCANTGVDNDCDGNAAELTNGVTTATACSVPNVYGVCAASTYVCSGGALVCSQTVIAGTESCANTGVDNDCDADATELTNGIHGGDACATGLSGVCSAGTRACAAGVLACNQTTASSTEICDNLDNNCNGAIDEGCDDDDDGYCDVAMTKIAGSVTTCAGSGATAAGNDCNDACVTCFPGGTEICDGNDNNCNSLTDDSISSITCGFGVCQASASACVGGVPQSCTPNTGLATTESCSNTGVDNDCDGNTTEIANGVFTGDACATGQPGICAAGTRVCSGATLTCAQTTAAAAESCSNPGVDNDCDSDVSEIAPGIHAGDACVVGGGLGVCAAGTYACSGTTLTCVQTIAPGSVAETCLNTGFDDDCDGDATELTNGVHTGDGCTTGQPGVCSPGTQLCSAGALSCAATKVASAELCDNLDNDCNGAIDNGVALATCGIGACANTGSTCFAASCTPKASSAEICDEVDNNCSGATDEGCDDDNDNYCDAGMTVVGVPTTCTNGGGDCDDTKAGSNPTANEVCDGFDNDCDGTQDDSIPVLSCGVGECADTATACVGGVGQNCTQKAPNAEICDGKDNDCDGVNDNGLALSTCGIGACAKTGATCNPQSCDPNVGASPEICDDIDNDCDGTADDAVPLAVCGLGICQRTGTTCHGSSCAPGEPSLEICDGIDNDCNGVPDDGLPLAKCGVGACAATGTSCLPSSCAPLGRGLEVCDGDDDDCDGKVDNGCDDDGDGYCDTALTLTASPTCPNGGGDCDDELADSHPNAPELCDGKDNDCNLAADDSITTVFCGLGACKATGTACVDGVAEGCEPLAKADSDLCDLIDNDCDGKIDNGLANAGIPDRLCGVGACQVSVLGCVEGQIPECAPLSGDDEVCDGIDNDCNGETDDGKLCDGGFCVNAACVYPNYSGGGASGVAAGLGGSSEVIKNTTGPAALGGGGARGDDDKVTDPSGCGCREDGGRGNPSGGVALGLLVGLLAWRRRRAA